MPGHGRGYAVPSASVGTMIPLDDSHQHARCRRPLRAGPLALRRMSTIEPCGCRVKCIRSLAVLRSLCPLSPTFGSISGVDSTVVERAGPSLMNRRCFCRMICERSTIPSHRIEQPPLHRVAIATGQLLNLCESVKPVYKTCLWPKGSRSSVVRRFHRLAQI